MLYIIKQVKQSFINSFLNFALNSREAGKVQDFLKDAGETIDTNEINKLVITNKKLAYRIRLEAKRAYVKLQKTQGNNIDLSDFMSLLKGQRVERDLIDKTYHNKVYSIKKSSNKIAGKYINQLQTTDKVLSNFENKYLGRNDFISKNIGIFGALNGIFEKQPTTRLENYLANIAGKDAITKVDRECAGKGPRVKKGVLVMVLKAIATFALSGGTSITLDLFGIKIGETAVDKGKMYDLLKVMGVKNPVRLADVIKGGKLNTRDAETISRLLAGEHFDGGTEKRTIDTIVFRDTPFLIKALLKIFGAGDKLYKLLDKYSNPRTSLKQRTKLTAQINALLKPYIDDIDVRIGEIKEGNAHGHPEAILDSRFPENKSRYVRKLQKIKRMLLKAFQQNQDVADHTGDLKRKTYGGASRAEHIRFNRDFDRRYGLKPTHKLDISNGKFGLALPKKLTKANIQRWLRQMETGYVGKKSEGTAIANMIGYISETYNISKGSISLNDFKQAILNGKYLNEAGRNEFKKLLTKNMSRTGGGNLKIGNYPIFVMKLGGRTIYLKQNCSNVEDITPDVGINVYKPEYFTVSATIKTGTKTITNTERVKREDHTDTNPEGDGGANNAKTDGTSVDDGTTDDIGGGDGSTPDGPPTGGPDTDLPPTDGPDTDLPPTDGPTTPGGDVEPDVPVYETVTTTTTTKTIDIDFIKSTIASNIVDGMVNDFGYDEISKKIKKPKSEVKKIIKKLYKKNSKGKLVERATSPVATIDSYPGHNQETVGKKIYTVKKGDTLTKIARKYKTTINHLKRKNKIKNVNKIRIGQKIEI